MNPSSNLFALVPDPSSHDKLASDGSNGQTSDLQIASTPIIIGGHTLVYSPSGLDIDGQILQPGSSVLTISNTPISLSSSGFLVFRSSSMILPSQSSFVIGSQTFATNPTGFPLDAGSIPPDGPLSGILAMGTSKLSLPDNGVFTVAGQLIPPNPSTFLIAVTAISAGDPAVILLSPFQRLLHLSINHSSSLVRQSLPVARPSLSRARPFHLAVQLPLSTGL